VTVRLFAAIALLLPACGPDSGVAVGDGLDCETEAETACAGALPLGYPCSHDDSCADGFYCRPLGGAGVCAQHCDALTGCPSDTSCIEKQCAWTAGIVGSGCRAEAPCHPGLECVKLDDVSYCTRSCDYDHACPPGENALCVNFGEGKDNFCMHRCQSDSDCESGLKCTPLTAAPEVTVCYLDL